MEIKHRVGLPKMPFHVMNRGARKVAIFDNDGDRSMFVHMLGKFTLKHKLRMTSWALMPNHYHLEPEGEGTPLTRMMHDLDGSYARYYNEKYGGSGCLFQGRFKSMAIQDEDGLAYVSRYIHANPVALGVRPEDYRWSSARCYLGLAPIPEWLDPKPVLGLMDSNPAFQRDAYETYLRAAPPPRRKEGAEPDDLAEFYADFMRHLIEKCQEARRQLGIMLAGVSEESLVSWIALRRYKIPAPAIAAYLGYRNGNGVRVKVWRFQQQLDEDPRLIDAIERVNEIVRRFPLHSV